MSFFQNRHFSENAQPISTLRLEEGCIIISRPKGRKIAQMATKTKFGDFYIVERILVGQLSN